MKLSMVFSNGEEEFIILNGVTKNDVKEGVLKLFDIWYKNKGFLKSSVRLKLGDAYIDIEWSKETLQDMQALFGISMIKEMAYDVTKVILPTFRFSEEVHTVQENPHYPHVDVVN